jgi:hypothetical protein
MKQFRGSFQFFELESDRFVLQTPFQFEDGDGFPIVLERRADGWRLTDEGSTASHLTVDEVDLTPARLEMLVDIAAGSGFGFDNFALMRTQADIPDVFDIADLVQAIAQLISIRYVTRDRVQHLYRDEVSRFIEQVVPTASRQMRWSPPTQ